MIKNLQIQFSYPWLLLVFLLGLGITVLLYFRLSKRYRKTRNRITSMILHIVVLALAVLTMAGMIFTYQIPNEENQIVLLVDMSDTEEQSAQARDDLVERILDMGQYDGYKIGVVTFGYDQVYAAELTYEIDTVMDLYLSADKPDTSATDIASALNYASNLFDGKQNGKIVLITDGKETDNEAESTIRSIAAKGICVDIAYVSSFYDGDDVKLLAAELPDYHVTLGSPCKLSVTLNANHSNGATVELYDNGVLVGSQLAEASSGDQTVTFEHTFEEYGIHCISFKATGSDDLLEQNNIYCTYLNIENFNKILVLEHQDGESELLKAMLETSYAEYEVKVVNIVTGDNVPATVEDLKQYDQVILNNIANSDMPEGFDALLYSYVNDYGGGLFTVGGSDLNSSSTGESDQYVAHSYNRSDMINSLYQSMLPVQAINYTPPVAVMIVIDRSGSMGGSADPDSKYNLALSGVASCLNALTERDYIGIMTLDSDYATVLELTPRSQEAKIVAAINEARDNGTGGSTVFPAAIERASMSLLTADVARRHVIIVTDGQVPTTQEEEYLSYIKDYHQRYGITYSVVGIGVSGSYADQMKRATDLGGGRLHAFSNVNDTARIMREELMVPEIKEVNYETFYPTIVSPLSPLVNGVELKTDENGKSTQKVASSLDGFYGVKAKSSADVILVGEYNVPIYAQWNFGKGKVGSFMCDLNGVWSADFMAEGSAGRQFILNAVAGLMPTESIRKNQLTVTVRQDNYTNNLSVLTELGEGERITGYLLKLNDENAEKVTLSAITAPNDGTKLSDLGCYVTSELNEISNYSRCTFTVKEGGIYELRVQKVDAAGNVLAEFLDYREFSYSEEYLDVDETVDMTSTLTDLAEAGNGVLIEDNEDPFEIFATFVTAFNASFDPRYIFMIIALVLFVTDVAVRKFKFKWPHELIRARGEKKNGGSEK